jgi:hypothetical protein
MESTYNGWTPTDQTEWARTFYAIEHQGHFRIQKAKGIHCPCYICDQLREWEQEDKEREADRKLEQGYAREGF